MGMRSAGFGLGALAIHTHSLYTLYAAGAIWGLANGACCAVLCCAVLCGVLCGAVLRCTVLRRVVCCAVLCGAVRCCAVL